MTATLPPQIQSLFAQYPALSGFSIVGAADVPDSCPREAEGYDLFVGDISFSNALGVDQCREIFQQIIATLADVLSEEPEALETLRGRTFARTLH